MHAKGRSAQMILPATRELEAAVMERMWSYGHAVQAEELLRDLSGGREVTRAALAKALGRLCRKGWLRREHLGGVRIYQAALSRQVHVDRLMGDALASRGRPSPVFALQLPSARGTQPMRCTLS